ncbi:MAG TPA: hypothetical protein VGB67_02430 [Fibrella sp.]|jgi:hypothetical protein
MNNLQQTNAIRALQGQVRKLEKLIEQGGVGKKSFLSAEDFDGAGTEEDPIRVIGGTGGGGSGGGGNAGTTTSLTFGNTFTNTNGVLTYPNGQSYHQATAAAQRIPSGVKARVWMNAENTDSDFILALNQTGTGGYQDFVYSLQLSYFQSNQRILRWNANVQSEVKNTVVPYVGLLHDTDNSISVQESADGVTWYDAVEYGTLTGDLYIMLSMVNSGKVYDLKLTTYA